MNEQVLVGLIGGFLFGVGVTWLIMYTYKAGSVAREVHRQRDIEEGRMHDKIAQHLGVDDEIHCTYRVTRKGKRCEEGDEENGH